MKRWIVILCLAGLVAAAGAQVNVQLRCQSENAAGKEVELLGYKDMLTLEEELLDRTVTDSSGHFELSCYLRYPRLVVVQIEDYSQSFFAEPGRIYDIYLPHFQWEQDEVQNIHLAPVALPLRFENLPADELNLRVLRWEDSIAAFLSRERVHLDPRFKPSRRWMDSLEAVVAPLYTVGGESFYDRYARFQLAEMRYSMRFASRSQMLRRYVFDRPVLYHDENYMRLLFSLLEHQVSLGTQKLPKWQIAEWVNGAQLDVLLDSLGTDPLLHDEQLRELAALVALKECYYDADYYRPAVRQLVSELGLRSKFEDHHTLATHLLSHFDRTEEGSEAAPIVLPNVDHQPVDMQAEMEGKWVYLSFVRVGDAASLRELRTMAHFYDTLRAKHPEVELVTICCDREFQKMYHFLRNSRQGSRYGWLWMHYDGDYRLLERYGVVSYPTFVLLTPEGQRYYSATPSPESGILLHGPWEQPKPQERSSLPFIRQED